MDSDTYLKDQNIYYQYWAAKDPDVTLIIVHGLGEHSNRYADLGEYLAAHKISAYALDLRGHGRSEGPKGHIERFDDYVSDLDELVKIAKTKEKVCILGHSLGSLVSLEYIYQHPESVSRAILSGVNLTIPFKFLGGIPLINRIPIVIFEICAKLFGKRAIAGLCSNEKALEDYLKDKLAHGRFTLKFLRELSVECAKLKNEVKNIKTDCLIMMGKEDRMGSVKDAEWLYSSLPTEEKKLIVYEGMKHNIFDEVDKERVFSDVREWALRT